jgi:hypothetical protein
MPSIVARRRISSPDPIPGRPPFAVPGVDVLAKQRDLAHAGSTGVRALSEDPVDGAGDLGTAGIGHDAEGAELVAAFLHGEKGGHAAGADGFCRRIRQSVELVFGGKLGLDDALAVARPRQRLGQAVIGLRPDDHIDNRRAADDLLAFGLGHTAGDRDHQVAAFGIALSLELGQPAKLRIDLFGGLFADMAGVEQNEIGILDRIVV